MPRRNQGMTLIEIVIVVVIAGILAGIALPSYRSYVLRANRSEGRAALLTLAAAQENFYLQCNAYATALDPNAPPECDTGTLRLPTRSERGYYGVSVTTASATAWNAAAVAVATSPQSQDFACWSLELDSTGTKTATTSAGLRNDGECWKK